MYLRRRKTLYVLQEFQLLLLGGGGGRGVFFSFCFLNTSFSIRGSSGRLTWVNHSSHKSSATHFYRCVQYFRVSKQWYGCQSLGFLTSAQMVMHAIAYAGCTDTVRESALKAAGLGEKSLAANSNPLQYCALDFYSDDLPTELFPLVDYTHDISS